ncbi:MAG: cysteine synthase family protein [Bacillota bacterium]|nr:cysteine synthase family protein [Bacillota bacterium]
MELDWQRNRKIAESIFDTAGLTPLVRLGRSVAGTAGGAEILAKLEYYGPTGSLKDRILFRMVEAAERRGELRPGMTIIEGTTGNTGIAASMVAAVKGYPCIIVMPAGMSEERKLAITMYGAELRYTAGGESDVDVVLDTVREIVEGDPGRYWEAGQFENPDNVAAHYATTGPEIWEQTGGLLDVLVAAQGSGGTLSGAGRYLKQQAAGRGRRVLVYAVEPSECPVLSRGEWGTHGIEGIGDGFVPGNLHLDTLDGVVQVSTGEAVATARRLAREEGIFCGISSGCNVAAAQRIAERHTELRRIVTFINDHGFRYFSTPLCGHTKQVEVPDRQHPLLERDRAKIVAAALDIIR